MKKSEPEKECQMKQNCSSMLKDYFFKKFSNV